MISFTIKTSGTLSKQIEAKTEKALRLATYSVWFIMRKRIFNDGLKASGAPIGTYSADYLKIRQTKYNRTSDAKKILVLTDSLRLNFVWDAINKTSYAIGVNGSQSYGGKKVTNIDKVKWNDPTNEIFIVSIAESKAAKEAFEKEMNN